MWIILDTMVMGRILRACPKTGGTRPLAERKPSRGVQHRTPGPGLVDRVVLLAGLPDGNQRFFYTHGSSHPIFPEISMALTRAQKEEQLADLKDKLQKSQSVIFAHYIGLTVTDVGDLRAKLRAKKAEMKVGKKTLIRMAMKELNLPEPGEKDLDGPVACIFSYEDPMSGASVAFAYGKTNDKVKLIGGLFEGKLLTANEAKAFASLPSREVLLATFAMMIRSPLTKFASMANGPLSGFARALSQIAEKGGAKTSETPPSA